MMEWVLILTLWNGETQYQVYGHQATCQAIAQAVIAGDTTERRDGPPQYMHIYCDPLAPGEPIVEWWKICAWRDGCWGPDMVNWTNMPPTRPGWYLHRSRTDEHGVFGPAHPFKVDYLNGLLSIVETGIAWRHLLPDFPVANVGGEWTQDALVLRPVEEP